ncbi:hypothetical protein LDL59_13255 [Kaistella anthropi]|nr:hypothetical protein [Kaistella anthropi]
MKFELSFTNKEITPWGGMVFLKQMLDKIGFREQIEKCESLPVSLSIILIKKKFCLNLLLRVFGVAPIVFCTQKLPVQIRLLGKYLAGERPCSGRI